MGRTIKDNREVKLERKNKGPKKLKMQTYSRSEQKRMTENN